jgi:hypothetical protein
MCDGVHVMRRRPPEGCATGVTGVRLAPDCSGARQQLVRAAGSPLMAAPLLAAPMIAVAAMQATASTMTEA